MRHQLENSATSGQAMVEFAVTVVALLMLLLGIVSMARAVQIYEVVSSAAREGTRYGIAHGPTSKSPASITQIRNVVLGELTTAGLDPAALTIDVSWPSDTFVINGTDILVQVTYPFTPQVPFTMIPKITVSSGSRMLAWRN
jgi:Flp pilus assembly protein TadG